MARSRNNPILIGASGAVGNTVVIKQYVYGTVLSNYPDMSGVKPSAPQKSCRSKFREAVAYARAVKNDPKKSARYRKMLSHHVSVYHAALADYLKSGKSLVLGI